MMKIALFINPSIARGSFMLLLLIYIGGTPAHSYAGFFSNLVTKPIPNQAPVSEIVPVEENQGLKNSQTIPLLESSINPDLVNIKDALPTTIIEDEALASNSSPLGPNLNISEYASSAKISTYIVKSGDTLESIAKKLKISKSTILSSNSDLKSTDLLKVGQDLTILPIEGVMYKVKKGDTLESIAKKYNAKSADVSSYNALGKSSSLKVGETIVIPGGKLAQNEDKTEKPIALKDDKKKTTEKVDESKPVETFTLNLTPKPTETTNPVNLSIPALPNVEVKTEVTTPPDIGQEGTISGGYIWPFPAGAGRVSQGLHGDQGYDFAAPKGTPIFAIQSGTVLIADRSGYNGGYGLYVVINFDDGGQAIFGHMSKVDAEPGQIVKRGEIIGYVGSTGKSTGNHVHIGYRGGKPSPYKGLKVNSTGLTDHD
jgi:murein DD-endopeptidase MepM/ murein hydrolase activator NlpD